MISPEGITLDSETYEGVKRGESASKDMYNGMIILKKDGKGGYYILTGYPTK